MTPPCHRQVTFGRGTLLAKASAPDPTRWEASGMRRQVVVPAAVAALALGLTGCSQSGNPTGSAPRQTAASNRGGPADVSAVSPVVAADYSRAVFTAGSAQIDNPWMGFTVGRQWEMRGSAIDGKQTIKRRVVATVTDLTKVVDGVRTA